MKSADYRKLHHTLFVGDQGKGTLVVLGQDKAHKPAIRFPILLLASSTSHTVQCCLAFSLAFGSVLLLLLLVSLLLMMMFLASGTAGTSLLP